MRKYEGRLGRRRWHDEAQIDAEKTGFLQSSGSSDTCPEFLEDFLPVMRGTKLFLLAKRRERRSPGNENSEGSSEGIYGSRLRRCLEESYLPLDREQSVILIAEKCYIFTAWAPTRNSSATQVLARTGTYCDDRSTQCVLRKLSLTGNLPVGFQTLTRSAAGGAKEGLYIDPQEPYQSYMERKRIKVTKFSIRTWTENCCPGASIRPTDQSSEKKILRKRSTR